MSINKYNGTEKIIKKNSGVKFVQVIQKNIEFLEKHKYLSTEEIKLLWHMQAYVALGSNALVKNVNGKTLKALSIKDISDIRDCDRSYISKIINNLIKKGILAKVTSGTTSGTDENNIQSKDYVLIINPNIILSGDKNELDKVLMLAFQKQMRNRNVLKDLPIKLF